MSDSSRPHGLQPTRLLCPWDFLGKNILYIYTVYFFDYIASALLELYAAAAAKSLQSCPILCDPIDVSPPGSPVPGILQARTLEWVAISFSNA